MKEFIQKFLQEFKDFALKGNVMDLAVGVIIGGAFSSIVTSLTDNFINPILQFFTSGARYSLQDIGRFGSNFLSSVVNFLIMAFILFCIMKAINTAMSIGQKKDDTEEVPTTKVCPFCKSEIAIDATRCPHCTSMLEEKAAEVQLTK